MSGCSNPTPPQNSFSPPPEPVDSTTGVAKPLVWPNCSATAAENGKTVDDPTILIVSRMSCAAAVPARKAARMPANAVFINLDFMTISLLDWNRRGADFTRLRYAPAVW